VSRVATLAASFGVGSLHVGIQHVNPQDGSPIFHFVANSPFEARIFATQNFSFGNNTGFDWEDITDRAKPTSDQDADFVIVNGSYQKKKESALGLPVEAAGLYALGNGFRPAGLMVVVTTVTSGDALGIHFGI
jgi:hypothetical protein